MKGKLLLSREGWGVKVWRIHAPDLSLNCKIIKLSLDPLCEDTAFPGYRKKVFNAGIPAQTYFYLLPCKEFCLLMAPFLKRSISAWLAAARAAACSGTSERASSLRLPSSPSSLLTKKDRGVYKHIYIPPHLPGRGGDKMSLIWIVYNLAKELISDKQKG